MGKTLDVTTALDVGRRAETLLTAHAARLEPRLAPRTAAELARTIGVLDGGQAGIPVARHDAKGATLSERELAEQLAAAIQILRDVFKSKKLSASQLKALGVGLVVNPGVTKSVIAGASAIVKVASAPDAQLAPLGMKPRDLENLRGLMQRLANADSSQRDKKGTSTTTTSARDSAIHRAFELAYEVGSAGALEFSPVGSDAEAGEQPDPDLEKLFRALQEDAVLPSKRSAKKKPAAPNA